MDSIGARFGRSSAIQAGPVEWRLHTLCPPFSSTGARASAQGGDRSTLLVEMESFIARRALLQWLSHVIMAIPRCSLSSAHSRSSMHTHAFRETRETSLVRASNRAVHSSRDEPESSNASTSATRRKTRAHGRQPDRMEMVKRRHLMLPRTPAHLRHARPYARTLRAFTMGHAIVPPPPPPAPPPLFASTDGRPRDGQVPPPHFAPLTARLVRAHSARSSPHVFPPTAPPQ